MVYAADTLLALIRAGAGREPARATIRPVSPDDREKRLRTSRPVLRRALAAR